MFKTGHTTTTGSSSTTSTGPMITGKGMQQCIKLEPQGFMPMLGLGTWKVNNKESIKKAIQHGYRMFDCSPYYENETMIGEAFHECINSGMVKREELFITSKLWCTDHDPKYVMEACQRTLKDLRLDYLDMFQIHYPLSMEHTGFPPKPLVPKDAQGHVKLTKVPLFKTWKAMEDLVKKGLVKSIGVCNFTLVELLDLLSYCEIRPALNQIEIHPYFSRENLVRECHWLGIPVAAYSPLGSMSTRVNVMQDETLKKISSKYGKTPAQVCLRWCVQRGIPVIPKSIHENRIQENCNIFDFTLTEEEMKTINQLNRNCMAVSPREVFGFDLFAW